MTLAKVLLPLLLLVVGLTTIQGDSCLDTYEKQIASIRGTKNYQLYEQYAAELDACRGYGKRHLLEDGPRRLLKQASPTVVANCNAAYEAALANAQAVGDTVAEANLAATQQACISG
ncbi:hypothetical protein WJX73_000257 [Symbiochloris irregularis]|uniref:Secreted protein n=1 Tax=Symbiochloris irregularis TaxID=706552 RepID=A0AAW1P4U9_9CHLO